MFKIESCLANLKYYEPKIISIGSQKSLIKSMSYVSDNTVFQKNILYVGKFSNVQYRFQYIKETTLFLLKDDDVNASEIEYGDNCVVLFAPDTDIEELYENCREYVKMQMETVENNHKLMDSYLLDSSLQSLVNVASEIICNPVMIIDKDYHVVCYSNYDNCGDLQWEESIAKGHCSYEFISQFNKISEIRSSQNGVAPFMAGCLMSSMRRCICKMFINNKIVGHLLAIESEKPFNEGMIQIFETTSKLASKEWAFNALQTGQNLYHSEENVLINAVKDLPGAKEKLERHIKSFGLREDSQYYMILVSLKEYDITNFRNEPLNSMLNNLFPRCIFSYYENNVLILVDTEEENDTITCRLNDQQTFFKERSLKVAISDAFIGFCDIARYYQQTKRVVPFIGNLTESDYISKYDEIRQYDMILTTPSTRQIPLYIRSKEYEMYIYDQKNGTEYLKTLYYYVKHGKALQYAADELFIHKNTLSYRIGRAKELFELDYNDADTRIG